MKDDRCHIAKGTKDYFDLINGNPKYFLTPFIKFDFEPSAKYFFGFAI